MHIFPAIGLACCKTAAIFTLCHQHLSISPFLTLVIRPLQDDSQILRPDVNGKRQGSSHPPRHNFIPTAPTKPTCETALVNPVQPALASAQET